MWYISVSLVFGVLFQNGLIQAKIEREAQYPQGGGTKLLTYNVTTPYTSPDLAPDMASLNWVHDPSGDGHTISAHNRTITVSNIFTNATRILVNATQTPKRIEGFVPNVDHSKVLYVNGTRKGYRYSKYSNYFVQDLKSGSYEALVPGQKSDISLALWSPKDPNIISFVQNCNIYIWNNGKVTKITSNGGSSICNGVPDWVYEEEVIEGRSAQWFSPDGQYVAFFSFDDTAVREYTVQYYMDGHQYPMPYPRQLTFKFPKPGTTNPIAKAHVFKISEPSRVLEIPLSKAFPIDELVIGELAWVTDTHEKLIIRCFNRVQNRDKHVLYEVSSGTAKIVRERNGDDGWLDNTRAMQYVGNLGNSSSSNGFYIDLSDKDGWTHLYIYPVDGGEPKQLTSGQWEIRNINFVNKKTGFVYYTSSKRHPTESHVFSVSLHTGESKPLVNPNEAAHWEASFSNEGEFVSLAYLGPNVPYQELYLTNETGPTAKPLRVLEDNAALVSRLKEYALPKIRYMDLAHPSGVKLSAMLRLPPNFSEAKKYPLLLTPYGGPGSQQVVKTFHAPGWADYISSDPALEYVTYTVDNRGTGQRGRAFRNFLAKASGTVDVEDQLWAARELAKQPWVDREHIGIWGWSNGGYLTLKVVEHGSDLVSFAMATAPTVDDRLYDSIYSERYLGLPDKNKAVWDRAAIRNVTGFKNIAGSVLIQHGTGDDNVHFAHTLGFLDILMAGGVPPEKFQVQPFTDSDHNIRYNRDSEFLYRQLTRKLFDEKNRKPAAAKQQWEVDSDGMKAEEWVKRVREEKNDLMEEPIFKTRWKTSGTGFDDFTP